MAQNLPHRNWQEFLQIRHADAGYDIAVDTAKERHVHVPMLDIE